jgi:mRNA interferase MazF
VISNRKLAMHGLVSVAMITGADNERWPGDIAIADLDRTGLPAPSVVRPAKIACIEPARIDRRIGRLGKAAARAVAQRVRDYLGRVSTVARFENGRSTPSTPRCHVSPRRPGIRSRSASSGRRRRA